MLLLFYIFQRPLREVRFYCPKFFIENTPRKKKYNKFIGMICVKELLLIILSFCFTLEALVAPIVHDSLY